MNKKFLISIFLPILFLALFLNVSYAASTSVTGHKIIIDAGHGGSDSGSTACQNLPEKTVNLDIAIRLRNLLQANSANVVMTRIGDATLSNNDRYTLANNSKGEVLVSIHLNGSTNTLIDGTQGLYGKSNKDKSFTQIMHNSVFSTLKTSSSHFTDFGITNFASGLLLKTTMPATIQETVFISNTTECNLLKDGSGIRQQKIAESLYNGLINWFSQPQPLPKLPKGN